MKNSCKISWLLNLVLIVALAGVAYKFIVVGNVVKSTDGRTALVLEAGERDLVLKEMRGFLEAIQAMTDAIGKNDTKAIAKAAKGVGMGAVADVPATLMAKLPLEFKELGVKTHKAFDALSVEVAEKGDSKMALKTLSTIMLNCTGCHAGYRLEAGPAK